MLVEQRVLANHLAANHLSPYAEERVDSHLWFHLVKIPVIEADARENHVEFALDLPLAVGERLFRHHCSCINSGTKNPTRMQCTAPTACSQRLVRISISSLMKFRNSSSDGCSFSIDFLSATAMSSVQKCSLKSPMLQSRILGAIRNQGSGTARG